MANRDLHELTTHCIRCGFCLEACPTFKITGDEQQSPRGRIYLVRSQLEGQIELKDLEAPMANCLGCRACETACPSGVEYGSIFEMARDRIERENPSWAKGQFVDALTSPTKLRLQLGLSKFLPGKKVPRILSQILSGTAPEAAIPKAPDFTPRPPLDESQLPAIRGGVLLLTGCVMGVLYPQVHEATTRLLRRVGLRAIPTASQCCGALHAHNGYLGEAQNRAEELVKSLPKNLPLIVNSAGCGSTLKEYEVLIGDAEFGKRVFDASEFLLKEGLESVLANSKGIKQRVTYHDACHLAHGQKITEAPRKLIQAIPGIAFIELTEADTCCGSAGIYNILKPKMARDLLTRKWQNIEATNAEIVATGNPGCHAWIAQAAAEHGKQIEVLHTLELLERAF